VSIAPPHATKFGWPLAFRRARRGVKTTQGFATFAEARFGLLGVQSNGEVDVLMSPTAPIAAHSPK
jgi:hypothetical protein